MVTYQRSSGLGGFSWRCLKRPGVVPKGLWAIKSWQARCAFWQHCGSRDSKLSAREHSKFWAAVAVNTAGGVLSVRSRRTHFLAGPSQHAWIVLNCIMCTSVQAPGVVLLQQLVAPSYLPDACQGSCRVHTVHSAGSSSGWQVCLVGRLA